ncbi:MAG: hypothetical protein HYR55_18495 [Acidobacteria bacterium]|nr:hypothetical protein [Acidobacteriota bacterium]MBI3657647.1 hypothetical protein [Acidobacteriota bacterium]
MKTQACLTNDVAYDSAGAADVTSTKDSVRAYRHAHETDILVEFYDLLKIPHVARDLPNIRKNADLIMAMMRRRGIESRLLEGRVSDTPLARPLEKVPMVVAARPQY